MVALCDLRRFSRAAGQAVQGVALAMQAVIVGVHAAYQTTSKFAGRAALPVSRGQRAALTSSL